MCGGGGGGGACARVCVRTNSKTAVHLPPDSQCLMPRHEASTPSSCPVWGHIANCGRRRRKEKACVRERERVCVCVFACVRGCVGVNLVMPFGLTSHLRRHQAAHSFSVGPSAALAHKFIVAVALQERSADVSHILIFIFSYSCPKHHVHSALRYL